MMYNIFINNTSGGECMGNKALIVLTDYDWYSLLNKNGITKEVNFWTPTPWKIKNLEWNAKVYFLLKKKYGRTICGYGHFVKYKEMKLIDSWNTYGIKNGVSNFMQMKDRVKIYLNKNSNYPFLDDNHVIGNIILKNIVFIDVESQKTPEYYGWSVPSQVVKNKYIEDNGFLISDNESNEPFSLVDANHRKFSTSKNKVREGQESFRRLLLKAYSGKCCITNEDEETVLQAAHIQEYISKKSNHVQNGLLIRVDFHSLFDQGLITINENFKLCVSEKLNSPYYRSFDGKQINLPCKNYRPSLDAIKWHNENVFLK